MWIFGALHIPFSLLPVFQRSFTFDCTPDLILGAWGARILIANGGPFTLDSLLYASRISLSLVPQQTILTSTHLSHDICLSSVADIDLALFLPSERVGYRKNQ